MVRMIVSLPERDKQWLEQTGRRRGCSSAEIVRRAIAHLRENEQTAPLDMRRIVAACAGRWKSVKKDGQKDGQKLVDVWLDEW